MYELHENIELELKSTPVYVPQTTRMLNTKQVRFLTRKSFPLGKHSHVVL
ncbi:hypothetical protein [Acetilactobacillus jinshanensis]|nr:hypothetical protein [Acetilactobacillus jinshanensis]URL61241.1 hypothetical protein HGK75_04400 [uncultured bacterium]